MTRKLTSKIDILPVVTLLILILVLIAQAASRQTEKAGVAPASPVAPSQALASSPVLFLPAVTHASGGYKTIALAVADLNGDGKPDVVVANYCDTGCLAGSVGVLLGKGNGAFQPVMLYGSGGYGPTAVAIADVNGDGKPDVVVANSGNVSVLLGNGDGTFQAAAAISGGSSGLAIADVNGDGKLDLIALGLGTCYITCTDGSVSVLLGNGNGTFQSAVPYDSGGVSPFSVAVADVNGDGKPDLLVANSGNVSVLLGNGDGSFQAALVYGSGGRAADSVAVADVNGDGKPDLLVANYCGITGYCGATSGALGVLLGNGDGTFQAAVTYGSGG
jgi:hypothetical protein